MTEPPEKLVEFLEQVAGRPIETREALGDYLSELRAGGQKAQHASRVGRFGAWLVVLVVVVLQYLVIEIFIEVNSLNKSQVLTPVRASSYRT